MMQCDASWGYGGLTQPEATCFLRTGYVVQGVNQLGRVSAHCALLASIRWEDGRTEIVDQYGHNLLVLDSGGRDARGRMGSRALRLASEVTARYFARREANRNNRLADPGCDP